MPSGILILTTGEGTSRILQALLHHLQRYNIVCQDISRHS